MKKLLTLSIIGFFTLSSFGVKDTSVVIENSTENVELQRWNYTCCNRKKGSYLMPVGSTHAQALSVAQSICGC